MAEARSVQHYAVKAGTGMPGAPSTPMAGSVDKLPKILRDAITGTGSRFVFACNPKLASSAQHVMTSIAGMVNCRFCRQTPAWLAAPDDWPDYPKDPAKVVDPAAAYLDEPAAPTPEPTPSPETATNLAPL